MSLYAIGFRPVGEHDIHTCLDSNGYAFAICDSILG